MPGKDVSVLWNSLKGLVCVYKPADVSVRRLQRTLVNKLCADLNKIHENEFYRGIGLKESDSKDISVNLCDDLTAHPLVHGPRFEEMMFAASWSNFLGYNTSGVMLFGLRSGTKTAKFIRENRSTRAYRIKGVLGQATDTTFRDGKVIERSTWRHIRHFNMDRMLSAMQAAHQKKMFEMCGVDIQSQVAYELAVKGPIRPVDSKLPIIYGLKCVDFEGPGFTLEIQCINEYETYLKNLVHEIGIKLHSTAHCTDIKCIRHSCFNLDHALLPKHWNIQNILDNLKMCRNILYENGDLVKQDSIALRQLNK